MEFVKLDLYEAMTGNDIHNALIEAFELPLYYGRNLDALYDILSTKHVGKQVSVTIPGTEDKGIWTVNLRRI